jgi:hypothetical protein
MFVLFTPASRGATRSYQAGKAAGAVWMKLVIRVEDSGHMAEWVGQLELLALARADYGEILLACVNELAKRVSARKTMAQALGD